MWGLRRRFVDTTLSHTGLVVVSQMSGIRACVDLPRTTSYSNPVLASSRLSFHTSRQDLYLRDGNDIRSSARWFVIDQSIVGLHFGPRSPTTLCVRRS
mmetsp:Transcript_14439/g.34962  ORF Transcript_14439/g.34962 Transcript_14439/m.34962 type:complete len:98 (+) Transcript_14439:249-542(+)